MTSFASLVDPFHGVDGPGNCLCGPHLPLSLVRLNPQVLPPHQTNGYSSHRPILGFTHTNVSGTGGFSRYGNIRITPHTGLPRLVHHGFDRADERASPGFYGVTMLHMPWLYHYAGRPDLSVGRVRWAMERFFRPARDGLDDNEDMGCQSAFYMASALGLYPLMGQDLYWLAAPVFDEVRIRLGETDRHLVILADRESDRSPFIVAAELNGQPLDRAWLRHAEIAGGATLRLRVADRPGDWGRGRPPPSPLAT